MAKTRCVNYDWVEVFAMESDHYPARTVSYYESYYGSLNVVRREYGTPMYRDMITIYNGKTKLIEVRRDPLSKASEGGIFPDRCCHIRLTNRSCYLPDPIGFLLAFLRTHHLEYVSTKRIDVCLDFNRFDGGDDPATFLRKYHARKYAKFYQREFFDHGRDQWQDAYYNSVKWGSPTSVITTKLYNKTEELARPKCGKPYIVDAWRACGLDVNLPVWRVEFSIRPDFKNLVKEATGETMPVDIMQFRTRGQLLNLFFMLADRYFKFCYVEKRPDGKLQRKDRCRRKMLFRIDAEQCGYKPYDEPTTAAAPDKVLFKMLDKLMELADETKTGQQLDHIYYTAKMIIEEYAVSDFYKEWLKNRLTALISTKYDTKL